MNDIAAGATGSEILFAVNYHLKQAISNVKFSKDFKKRSK